MHDLAEWLDAHRKLLVETAVNELAQSESLRAQVVEATDAFYDSLIRTVRHDNPVSLNLILLDWIEARSAPTEDEMGGLQPVLSTLKTVAWDVICDHAPDDVIVRWLTELERIFSVATAYLSKEESSALVTDLNAELDRTKVDLERLNKSKSDFIAVAAHELKTPLTLIEGYTNMLRAQYPEDQHPRVAQMLTGILGGTKRLREIIQDMIDASVIDMGLLTLHYQPVWLRRLIDIVEFEVADAVKQRSLTFTIDRESLPEKPTYADPERLYQVFHKVVSNAIKYTPDGGRITLRARELPGFTQVIVQDTGIGIAWEDMQRIFEKFALVSDVALHSSGKTKFKGGGPGLGLAIARGIIDAHGGSIWAESPGYDEEKLPGSIFYIMVPMRGAPVEDQMAELFSGTRSPTAQSINNPAAEAVPLKADGAENVAASHPGTPPVSTD